MPVLRQPHDHHRDFHARLRAETPTHAARGNQDRHLMMPSPAIYTYSNARHSRWLSASTAQARIAALHSIAVARPILSRYPQIARSNRRMPPWFATSRSRPASKNLHKLGSRCAHSVTSSAWASSVGGTQRCPSSPPTTASPLWKRSTASNPAWYKTPLLTLAKHRIAEPGKRRMGAR